MATTTSKDGTTIAVEANGSGLPVVLVAGALQPRIGTAPVAALLEGDYTVYNYDRRGRGESGNTQPYAPEREVEDLEAVIGMAGGTAFVFGTSSGGNLALRAAASGAPITKLALWEPNFLVDDSRPPLEADYAEHQAELVAADRRGDAVEHFMTHAVGMPSEFVAPMRELPFWPAMEAVAHTLAYDGAIVGESMSGRPLDTHLFAAVTTPTLVLEGGQAPWLVAGARALAEALPNAEVRRLEGQTHDVAPDVLAPALKAFFS
jgi:acetyl esterase/lipase